MGSCGNSAAHADQELCETAFQRLGLTLETTDPPSELYDSQDAQLSAV
jgi:hypothetical protein